MLALSREWCPLPTTLTRCHLACGHVPHCIGKPGLEGAARQEGTRDGATGSAG